jgi:hypothetical protein
MPYAGPDGPWAGGNSGAASRRFGNHHWQHTGSQRAAIGAGSGGDLRRSAMTRHGALLGQAVRHCGSLAPEASRKGRPEGTAGRDGRKGRPEGTAGRDGRKGRPPRSVSGGGRSRGELLRARRRVGVHQARLGTRTTTQQRRADASSQQATQLGQAGRPCAYARGRPEGTLLCKGAT